jgi:glycosyltransferase involved in cell wall biosynthesis
VTDTVIDDREIESGGIRRKTGRVLFLAYHFPPIGGGGVQRNAKFVRYLHEHGWDPIVLTGPGGATDRWTPADETLRADVPPGTVVLRVPGPEPELSSGWRSRLERGLQLQTPFTRWWTEGSLAVARELEDEVDAIFGSLVPYDCAESAMRISQALGKPWVADLQDPWALDEMWVYPTTVHRVRDRARMRRFLGSAATIVMNTPESARRTQIAFPELAERVCWIPNGFDPADLDVPPAPRGREKFRIVHTGYFHTDVGMRLRATRRYRRVVGGALGGVDIATRSPLYLLQAVERLIEADPGLESAIEVICAGALSGVDRELLARYPFVTTPGYVSHHDGVALLRSADLVFLPMHDLPEGSPAGIVPGKTYEYLGSGRPILAAVPDGDAGDLLAAAGTAFVARPKDVAGMARIIAAQIDRVRAGEPDPVSRRDVLAPFERRNQAGELARVLEATAEGLRPPAPTDWPRPG